MIPAMGISLNSRESYSALLLSVDKYGPDSRAGPGLSYGWIRRCYSDTCIFPANMERQGPEAQGVMPNHFYL